MLTKDDLNQIKGVIKEEIRPVILAVEAVDKKLDKAQEDISVILTEVIAGHDKLEKRVERIEDNLDISNTH